MPPAAWRAAEKATPALRCAGGTRFIGLYLARQLIEEGHEVTLYTRGKKPISYQIPDDTPASFEKFSKSVKHIAGDRMVGRPARRRSAGSCLAQPAAACSLQEQRDDDGR